MGFAHACAITSDGAPYCWGRGWGDTPQPVPATVTFQSLDGDFRTFCGLTESGEAWCWGSNDEGQFGNGERDASSDVYHTTPVPVLTDLRFSQIAVGSRHACGIDTETESAWCWGDDFNGQLGDGTRPAGASLTSTWGSPPRAGRPPNRRRSAGAGWSAATRSTTSPSRSADRPRPGAPSDIRGERDAPGTTRSRRWRSGWDPAPPPPRTLGDAGCTPRSGHTRGRTRPDRSSCSFARSRPRARSPSG